MKRRKFIKGILNHCYQRSADGGVLFYTYSDHLVFFTEYCLAARQYDIQVLSLCQMPDHIHDVVRTSRKENLAQFKRKVNTDFSRKYGVCCHTKGPVLKSRFGSAPKVTDKKARSNLVYVGNNPVERKLVAQAEQYRWNYLAYAVSNHPFSERLVIRSARWPLRKAINLVKAQFKAGRPMNYPLLQSIFEPLTREEGRQLTDFIVSTYNCIDYDSAISFFDSYEDMVKSMHATTGSEYDLNEVFVGKSDLPYGKMSAFLRNQGLVEDIHEILSLSVEQKYALFSRIRQVTDAPAKQIAMFLHMPLKEEKDLSVTREMEGVEYQFIT